MSAGPAVKRTGNYHGADMPAGHAGAGCVSFVSAYNGVQTQEDSGVVSSTLLQVSLPVITSRSVMRFRHLSG